jgi:hypothetical protein
MDKQLNVLHVGPHKFSQMLILGHLQVADELIQKHLIPDGFLRARNACCIHNELEGNLCEK